MAESLTYCTDCMKYMRNVSYIIILKEAKNDCH